jgi:hypothetical protein
MVQIAEPLEAVIISGPRRGEIVRISEGELTEVSDEAIEMINEALDEPITAIDKISTEVRVTTETLRKKADLREKTCQLGSIPRC